MSEPNPWIISQDLQISPEGLSKIIPKNYLDPQLPPPFLLSTGKGMEGYAWMVQNESDWGSDARLIHLCVQPPYRRQGLGTRLLEAMLEEARRQEIPQLITANGFKVSARGTPPPEVRFCQKLHGKVIRKLDTFHLGIPQAQALIGRLNHLSQRINQNFQWIPAHALNPEAYQKFMKEHIGALFASAHLTPPAEDNEMAELAIAALLPDQTTIAGIIVPHKSKKLAATLEYSLFAIAPEFRQSPLAASLLARSIGHALTGSWQDSRFQVMEHPDSAMWRFAKKHATLRGAIVHYAFAP